MSPASISKDQHAKIEGAISSLCKEALLDAVALCDRGGSILASQGSSISGSFDNAAALAAGSFAATRELASMIGENSFESIMHRGASKGLLIKAVGQEHIIVLVLGAASVEGMARLMLKRITNHILSVLSDSASSAESDTGAIEIKRANK